MKLYKIIIVAIAALFICGATSQMPSALVFKALTGTPRAWGDRNEPSLARNRRLLPVALAVSEIGGSFDERAALLAAGERESLWSARIGEDRCQTGPKDQRCDPDKSGNPQALGYWQLQRRACPAAWKLTHGPDRLLIEADCSLRVLEWAKKRCGGWRNAISGYRGKCGLSDSVIRARSFDAYRYAVEHGWPRMAEGWTHAKRVPRQRIAVGVKLTKRLGYGEFVEVPGEPRMAALVDWHWHDPSGDVSPKGWHRGVTFFVRGEL